MAEQRYIVEYNHGGMTWTGVEICAESWEEAERKLRSLKSNARILGQVAMRVEIRPDGLLARFLRWLSA